MTSIDKLPLNYTYLDTPIGSLLLVGQQETVHYVGFPKGKMAMQPQPFWLRDDSILSRCRQQLIAYFNGERRRFELNLLPAGTYFQNQVWQQLQQIPYGTTCSYKEIANNICRPKSVRAVGAANGRNPIPIIIPCHRVIGADGSLTGFGSGLDVKRYLLQLEGGSLSAPENSTLAKMYSRKTSPLRRRGLDACPRTLASGEN